MMRRKTLVAMVGAGLLLGCAGSSRALPAHASTIQAAQPLAFASPRRPQPWWSGFNDETLDRLIDTAHRHSASMRSPRPLNALPLEAGIAAAYVSIKVNSLGLVYLENERDAVERQLKLMIASRPQHDDFIKELSQRRKDAEDSIGKLSAQRDNDVGFLAAQCGLPEASLIDTIAEVQPEQLRRIPRFSLEIPRTLPLALLANRDEINVAAALYGIDPAASLAATSEPAQATESGEIDEPDAALRDSPLYFAAVERSRKEVSAALQHLQAQRELAGGAYQQALELKTRFEASTVRRDRGEVSEVILMEDFQTMLQGLHALAVADGRLAVAWIALIAYLGNGTSLEGSASSQAATTLVPSRVSQKPQDP